MTNHIVPNFIGTKMESINRRICKTVLAKPFSLSFAVYHDVSTARFPPSLNIAIYINCISTIPKEGIQALSHPACNVVKKERSIVDKFIFALLPRSYGWVLKNIVSERECKEKAHLSSLISKGTEGEMSTQSLKIVILHK